LIQAKGKWYVSVTVPKEMEHLFKQKQKRLSTGTSDLAFARKKQHDLAAKVYLQFDRELAQQNARATSAKLWAEREEMEHVYDLMQQLIDLTLKTISNDAEKQIVPIDIRRDMRFETPWRAQILHMIDFTSKELVLGEDTLFAHSPEDREQHLHTAKNYLRSDIQELVAQFRPSEFDEPEIETSPQEQGKPIEALLGDYLNNSKWLKKKIKSKNAANRQIRQFIEKIGNLGVKEIKKSHAYDFARALDELELSNSTIKSSTSAVSAMLTWCEQNAFIEVNPFVNLHLSDYGSKTKKYLPFTSEELHCLFSLPLPPQERFLLSILIATGMRLDEAALLTWEQVKLKDGIRYFDLVGALVKNEGSEREVALPDCLKLGEQGTGRIFDYTLDTDGKASHRASKILSPWIKKATNNPRKVTHSLRGTLKDFLRDANVPKETHDFITGHVGNDVASKYGSGPSLKTKYIAVNSVKHPWFEHRR